MKSGTSTWRGRPLVLDPHLNIKKDGRLGRQSPILSLFDLKVLQSCQIIRMAQITLKNEAMNVLFGGGLFSTAERKRFQLTFRDGQKFICEPTRHS